MVNSSKIRVRVAPSPTGYLHVGTAQSALYNWLFTRKNGGKFLLRIEDTDKERSTKEFEQSIYNALDWLGLSPDKKPVIQSVNLPRHKKMLEKLLAEGKAFYCYHTKEELEDERKKQEENKQALRHVCSDKRQTTNDKRQEKTKGIIRLAVDENSDRVISFDDQIRGRVEFKQSLLGDFAIARAVNDPLYHFAVVIDDIDMEISHVIRGEDHISNTPKQILIYEALGLSVPNFAHLPLILAPDRSKLSKRHGDTAVLSYKKDYLPEAMVNFLGSLSYTFSKEIISKEEMIEEFELSKVHKSSAVFDIKKLNWINSQYIKQLDTEIFKLLTNLDIPNKAVPIITERLEKLSDFVDFDYFWKEPSFATSFVKTLEVKKATEGTAKYDKNLLKWKRATLEESLLALRKVHDVLEKIEFTKESLQKALDKLGEELGDRGLAYWPLRVALTGKEKSPDPIDIALVLGKQKTLERVERAIGMAD